MLKPISRATARAPRRTRKTPRPPARPSVKVPWTCEWGWGEGLRSGYGTLAMAGERRLATWTTPARARATWSGTMWLPPSAARSGKNVETGEVVPITAWEPPADFAETVHDGARILVTALSLKVHEGELSVSGEADSFVAVGRERCPTPAESAVLARFVPRKITEAAQKKFYQKVNPEKLDDPGFLWSILQNNDDEAIISKCNIK